MTENTAPGWTFLSNHGQVLVCIARDPGVRLRDIGERVRITERAAHRIVAELADAGYITRERNGRRNQYVGQLLEILSATPAANRRVDRTGTSG